MGRWRRICWSRECANILGKKVRCQEIGPDEASLAGRLLAHTDIELLPMRRLLDPAARLAVQLDHPAYDCIYLALAQSADRSFVTADTRFCTKAQSHVPADQVLDLAHAPERLDVEAGQ